MQSTSGTRNALHEAVLFGRPHQVADLLNGTIDIDAGTQSTPAGLTPLMLAVMEGPLEIIRILLERGENTSITAMNGFKALHLAAERG